jgi:hypothetical protein
MYDVIGFCVTGLQVVGNVEYGRNCKKLLIKNTISLHGVISVYTFCMDTWPLYIILLCML